MFRLFNFWANARVIMDKIVNTFRDKSSNVLNFSIQFNSKILCWGVIGLKKNYQNPVTNFFKMW